MRRQKFERSTTPERVTADKLPDPWLLDTEYLLTDLARIRELALRVPVSLASAGPINSVIDAAWDLEQRLRYLLKLHRQGQWSFRRGSQPAVAETVPGGGSVGTVVQASLSSRERDLPARGRHVA
jgi:hypothetical protein